MHFNVHLKEVKDEKIGIVLLVLILAMGMVFARGKGEKEATGRRTLRISAESWQISKIYLEKARDFQEKYPMSCRIITLADRTYWPASSTGRGNTRPTSYSSTAVMAKTYLAQDLIYNFKELGFSKISPNQTIAGCLETGVYEGVQVCSGDLRVWNLLEQRCSKKQVLLMRTVTLPMKTWDDFYNFEETYQKGCR